jgi:hypothetical protein
MNSEYDSIITGPSTDQTTLSTDNALPNKKSVISRWIEPIRHKIDHLLSENNRWYILFGFVMLSYVYLFLNAKYGKDTDEKKETALLILPEKGGYNKVRGDPSSPHLFEWNNSEIRLIIFAIVISIGLFIYLRIVNKNTSWPIYLIQFTLIWSHTVLLLFLIPVNKFHTRILYNVRSLCTQIVNEPLKELFAAFLFIVLLPLPGGQSTKYSDRVSLLVLKIGLFYIFQGILLGKPNYKMEDASEEKIIPQDGKDLLGYGAFFVLAFLTYLFY